MKKSSGTTGGASGTIRSPRAQPAHRPRKRFAQHFLERPWVDRLVAAIDPQAGDTFIEIGPGRGALTLPLAGRVQRLIAVEIDRDLASALAAHAPANADIVEGDVLRQDLRALVGDRVTPGSRLRVVGNLPYNISTPVLFMLLRQPIGIHDATLMLQREVADRLLAAPHSREYGRLTVVTALHADVTRLFDLPPGAFRPAPAVHSTVVRLTFRPPVLPAADEDGFDALVRTVFSQRRKTLANALKPLTGSRGLDAAAIARQAGVDPGRRPDTLELAELLRLQDVMRSML